MCRRKHKTVCTVGFQYASPLPDRDICFTAGSGHGNCSATIARVSLSNLWDVALNVGTFFLVNVSDVLKFRNMRLPVFFTSGHNFIATLES